MNYRRVSKISCPIPGIREPGGQKPLVAGSDQVALLPKRRSLIEEVIADLFGISPGTVSEIIGEFTLLIAQATEEFRPQTEEAKADDPGSASAGRRHAVAILVMGARPRDVGREI